MALTRYLIKYIQSFKHSIMIFIKKGDQSSYSKMHVHIHMHDLLHLPRYTRTLSTYACETSYYTTPNSKHVKTRLNKT